MQDATHNEVSSSEEGQVVEAVAIAITTDDATTKSELAGVEAEITTSATPPTLDNKNETPAPATTATAASTTPSSKGSPLANYTRNEYAFMISAGVLLAFNAGFVNGACLSGLVAASGREQSVIAFTGGLSDSALEIASGNDYRAGFLVSMLLSFVLGVFIAGLLTPHATPYRIFPTYAPTFFIGSVFLIIGSIMAAWDVQSDRCFFFVAAANGTQNGISCLYTANLIRSTHMTGPSIDAALYLGQLFRGNTKKLWKLKVLLSLIVSLWTGSFVGYFAADRYTSYTLLFSAGLYVVIGMSLVLFVVKHLEVSYFNAVIGKWQWKKLLHKLHITEGKIADESRAMEIFHEFDLDRNGQIDAKELYLAMKSVGVRGISMDMAEKLIHIVDEDGNEQISEEEWMHLVHGSTHKK